MAERIDKVTREVTSDESDHLEVAPSGSTIAVRLIWLVTDILLVLLAFRFVLALLGANPSNSFANFIYSASHPFVAPFFSLFHYSLHYGVSRFETYTLVAMAVYAIIAFLLVRVVMLNQPNRRRQNLA